MSQPRHDNTGRFRALSPGESHSAELAQAFTQQHKHGTLVGVLHPGPPAHDPLLGRIPTLNGGPQGPEGYEAPLAERRRAQTLGVEIFRALAHRH